MLRARRHGQRRDHEFGRPRNPEDRDQDQP